MRANPVRQGLGPGRLGVGEVGGAEHGDEDLGLADLAGVGINDGDLLAGIVDEHFVAGNMVLAHGRREPALKRAEELAEAAVAIAVGMDGPVLLPEDLQGDAGLLQFDDGFGPVGLGPPALSLLDAGAGEKPVLQGLVGQVAGQGPAQAGLLGALEVLLDGAARDPEPLGDVAHADAVPGQAQHLSQLSHGQLPLGGHSILLDDVRRVMPELLTQGIIRVGKVSGN